MSTLDNNRPAIMEDALQSVAQAAQELFDTELCIIAAVNPVTWRISSPLFTSAGPYEEAIISQAEARLIKIAQSALEREDLCSQYLNSHAGLPP